MKTGEDCAIFPCPDVSPGGFEPPTFRLGGEPSIQLRYEDILDFPLFSRLCRDDQENHESNDSARRTSALWIPLSRFERRTKNSKFDLAHDNIFLRRRTLYPAEVRRHIGFSFIFKALPWWSRKSWIKWLCSPHFGALNPPFPFRTPNKKFEIRFGAW